MKKGDLLLFRRESGISKVIRWLTKSEYSHVAVCVSPEMNLVIEATAGLVRAADIRSFEEGVYDIYRPKHGEKYNQDEVLSFLVSKLNYKYDYAGVIYLGFLKLLRLKKTANTFQKDRDHFCSELVAEAFMAGGLRLVPFMAASVISPADISKSTKLERIKRA